MTKKQNNKKIKILLGLVGSLPLLSLPAILSSAVIPIDGDDNFNPLDDDPIISYSKKIKKWKKIVNEHSNSVNLALRSLFLRKFHFAFDSLRYIMGDNYKFFYLFGPNYPTSSSIPDNLDKNKIYEEMKKRYNEFINLQTLFKEYYELPLTEILNKNLFVDIFNIYFFLNFYNFNVSIFDFYDLLFKRIDLLKVDDWINLKNDFKFWAKPNSKFESISFSQLYTKTQQDFDNWVLKRYFPDISQDFYNNYIKTSTNFDSAIRYKNFNSTSIVNKYLNKKIENQIFIKNSLSPSISGDINIYDSKQLKTDFKNVDLRDKTFENIYTKNELLFLSQMQLYSNEHINNFGLVNYYDENKVFWKNISGTIAQPFYLLFWQMASRILTNYIYNEHIFGDDELPILSINFQNFDFLTNKNVQNSLYSKNINNFFNTLKEYQYFYSYLENKPNDLKLFSSLESQNLLNFVDLYDTSGNKITNYYNTYNKYPAASVPFPAKTYFDSTTAKNVSLTTSPLLSQIKSFKFLTDFTIPVYKIDTDLKQALDKSLSALEATVESFKHNLTNNQTSNIVKDGKIILNYLDPVKTRETKLARLQSFVDTLNNKADLKNIIAESSYNPNLAGEALAEAKRTSNKWEIRYTYNDSENTFDLSVYKNNEFVQYFLRNQPVDFEYDSGLRVLTDMINQNETIHQTKHYKNSELVNNPSADPIKEPDASPTFTKNNATFSEDNGIITYDLGVYKYTDPIKITYKKPENLFNKSFQVYLDDELLNIRENNNVILDLNTNYQGNLDSEGFASHKLTILTVREGQTYKLVRTFKYKPTINELSVKYGKQIQEETYWFDVSDFKSLFPSGTNPNEKPVAPVSLLSPLLNQNDFPGISNKGFWLKTILVSRDSLTDLYFDIKNKNIEKAIALKQTENKLISDDINDDINTWNLLAIKTKQNGEIEWPELEKVLYSPTEKLISLKESLIRNDHSILDQPQALYFVALTNEDGTTDFTLIKIMNDDLDTKKTFKEVLLDENTFISENDKLNAQLIANKLHKASELPRVEAGADNLNIKYSSTYPFYNYLKSLKISDVEIEKMKYEVLKNHWKNFLWTMANDEFSMQKSIYLLFDFKKFIADAQITKPLSKADAYNKLNTLINSDDYFINNYLGLNNKKYLLASKSATLSDSKFNELISNIKQSSTGDSNSNFFSIEEHGKELVLSFNLAFDKSYKTDYELLFNTYSFNLFTGQPTNLYAKTINIDFNKDRIRHWINNLSQESFKNELIKNPKLWINEYYIKNWHELVNNNDLIKYDLEHNVDIVFDWEAFKKNNKSLSFNLSINTQFTNTNKTYIIDGLNFTNEVFENWVDDYSINPDNDLRTGITEINIYSDDIAKLNNQNISNELLRELIIKAIDKAILDKTDEETLTLFGTDKKWYYDLKLKNYQPTSEALEAFKKLLLPQSSITDQRNNYLDVEIKTTSAGSLNKYTQRTNNSKIVLRIVNVKPLDIKDININNLNIDIAINETKNIHDIRVAFRQAISQKIAEHIKDFANNNDKYAETDFTKLKNEKLLLDEDLFVIASSETSKESALINNVSYWEQLNEKTDNIMYALRKSTFKIYLKDNFLSKYLTGFDDYEFSVTNVTTRPLKYDFDNAEKDIRNAYDKQYNSTFAYGYIKDNLDAFENRANKLKLNIKKEFLTIENFTNLQNITLNNIVARNLDKVNKAGEDLATKLKPKLLAKEISLTEYKKEIAKAKLLALKEAIVAEIESYITPYLKQIDENYDNRIYSISAFDKDSIYKNILVDYFVLPNNWWTDDFANSDKPIEIKTKHLIKPKSNLATGLIKLNLTAKITAKELHEIGKIKSDADLYNENDFRAPNDYSGKTEQNSKLLSTNNLAWIIPLSLVGGIGLIILVWFLINRYKTKKLA